MRIRIGFEIAYDCPQPTPILLMLRVHPSRAADLVAPDVHPHRSAALPITDYRRRLRQYLQPAHLPAGADDGPHRRRHPRYRPARSGRPGRDPAPIPDLPAECLVFLLGSRYCETDRLMRDRLVAVRQHARSAGRRVQAICDYVHDHVTFGYEHARPTKTASDVHIRACRRLPRLRPSRRHLLPLHEHPGALLHRLSRRHRRAARSGADGLQRLVRGLSRRPLVHLRRAPQHAAHRPHPDRAAAATPPTSRSATALGSPRSPASRCGPTRSSRRRKPSAAGVFRLREIFLHRREIVVLPALLVAVRRRA